MKVQVRKIKNSITPFFLILVISNLMIGCVTTGNYYKTKKWKDPVQRAMMIGEDEYVIIHKHGDAFHLDEHEINKEEQTLRGKRTLLDSLHMNHGNLDLEKVKYDPAKESPDNEVHVYANDYAINDDGTITIKAKDIMRLDVNKIDNSAKTEQAAGIGSGCVLLGCGGGAVLVVLLLVALVNSASNSSSCPFIYVDNGNNYQFAGEAYPGAIGPNMVRDDYLHLPSIAPNNGSYNIKISNKLHEIQHTDLAELWVVDHSQDVNVLIDENGKLFTISSPKISNTAMDDQGADLSHLINIKDNITYPFNGEMKENEEFSSIELSFTKPFESTEGKLVLSLKNTMWLDYIYNDFLSNWGSVYNEFETLQKNLPPGKKKDWTKNEGVQLAVKMKTKEGWELVKYIDTQGPMALRDVIVPVDQFDPGAEEVSIRLECGYHFWELDYAAIDFNTNETLSKLSVPVEKAVDEKGVNVKDMLLSVDENYLIQPEIGNEAVLNFIVPAMNQEFSKRTIFLHSRGYYEYIRNFDEQVNLATAPKIFKKGGFSKYSREELKSIIP